MYVNFLFCTYTVKFLFSERFGSLSQDVRLNLYLLSKLILGIEVRRLKSNVTLKSRSIKWRL